METFSFSTNEWYQGSCNFLALSTLDGVLYEGHIKLGRKLLILHLWSHNLRSQRLYKIGHWPIQKTTTILAQLDGTNSSCYQNELAAIDLGTKMVGAKISPSLLRGSVRQMVDEQLQKGAPSRQVQNTKISSIFGLSINNN